MGANMGKNSSLLDALPSGQGTLHVVMLGLDSAGKTTALYRLKFDQYLNTVPTIGFNCEKESKLSLYRVLLAEPKGSPMRKDKRRKIQDGIVRLGAREESVRGTIGRAKGINFLVWDVGGQEKLRPLWKSYTRCTDGIVFVLDSVDVERIEEAKMELVRTARSPDNSGVPILVLANKQDLRGAKEPKELEKLLGLHELGSNGFQNATIQNSSSRESNLTGSTKDVKECRESPSPGGNVPPSVPPVHLWHVQPACAITGEGLHEGMEALYEMILKKRKMAKMCKKKTR